MSIVVLDLETRPIQPRPNYPPEPVGLAMYAPGEGSIYMAWGHPHENNCTREQAVEVLHELWDRPDVKFVLHNASFDLSVFYERMGLPILPWHRVHDTMYLLFLYDPHSKSLGLKEASEELLAWPPEEQDDLYNWLWENRAEVERISGLLMNRGKFPGKNGSLPRGAFIGYGPVGLVGKYARGDVKRTWKLFEHLFPIIRSAGMEEAYDRERMLLPVLMENERVGLRVNVDRLSKDVDTYRAALESVEAQMRSYLRAPDLSFDNDQQIADVFYRRDVIHPDRWVRTKKSKQLSVSKENLTRDAFVDPLMADAFGYRNRLKTCLTMFMEAWLGMASVNNSYIHTSWNQVRNSRGGTRTGRPSMTKPNLLNVAKSFTDRKDEYQHPAPLDLPELPLVRVYILPDPGHLWLHRDFSGQELRIFAHFEQGDLMEAYLEDPRLDPHGWVRQEILDLTGKEYDRTSVKVVNFQSMYGGGIPALMKELRSTKKDAMVFKQYHDQALPGRKILNEEISRIVKRGEPIRTLGGRLYYVEPPSFSKKHNRFMTWEYKLINYIIQGSAADATKEAINRWFYGARPPGVSRFLLTVYDENNISAEKKYHREHMEFLKEVMNGIELDVPMLSDGKWGKAWGKLEKVPGE